MSAKRNYLSVIKPVNFGDYGMEGSTLNKKGLFALLDAMEQDFAIMEENLFMTGDISWDIFDDSSWSDLVTAVKDIRDFIETNCFIYEDSQGE